MWLRTVARLMPSLWAISLFCRPAATQRTAALQHQFDLVFRGRDVIHILGIVGSGANHHHPPLRQNNVSITRNIQTVERPLDKPLIVGHHDARRRFHRRVQTCQRCDLSSPGAGGIHDDIGRRFSALEWRGTHGRRDGCRRHHSVSRRRRPNRRSTRRLDRRELQPNYCYFPVLIRVHARASSRVIQ